MNLVLEILNAAAAFATVAGFILEVWREYKQNRMTREEREEPAATGSN